MQEASEMTLFPPEEVLADSEVTFRRQVFVLVGGLIFFSVLLLMPLPEGMTLPGKRLLAVAALMAC